MLVPTVYMPLLPAVVLMASLLQICTGSLSPGIFINNSSPEERHAAINEGHSPGFHRIELRKTKKKNDNTQ